MATKKAKTVAESAPDAPKKIRAPELQKEIEYVMQLHPGISEDDAEAVLPEVRAYNALAHNSNGKPLHETGAEYRAAFIRTKLAHTEKK